MAYGIYSEVYFAIGLSKSIISFKIGETTNARRRNKQLVGFDICETFSLPYGKDDQADRLLVESYIRQRMERDLKLDRFSTDCFVCSNLEEREYAHSYFIQLFHEALEIL